MSMIRNFLVSMFAILLFTLGAAGAWFYMQMAEQQQQEEEVATQTEEQELEDALTQAKEDPVPPSPFDDRAMLRAVVRGPELDADEMYRLSTATAATRDQLREYEDRLQEHKLRIKAADADTKAAQREVEGALEQVRNLLDATESLLSETRQQLELLKQQKAEVEKKEKDLEKLQTEAGAGVAANMKTFAEYMASMPAGNVAETLKEMTNSGKMDFAIQLLRKMEPRNASKILSEIEDPQLVAELAQRYAEAPETPQTR